MGLFVICNAFARHLPASEDGGAPPPPITCCSMGRICDRSAMLPSSTVMPWGSPPSPAAQGECMCDKSVHAHAFVCMFVCTYVCVHVLVCVFV